MSKAEIRVMLAELRGLTPPLLSLCWLVEAPRCAAWLWLLISLNRCLFPLCSLDVEVLWELPLQHRRNMKARLTPTHTHTPRGLANWVRHYAHESCLKVWKEVACRGAQNITKWNYFMIFLLHKKVPFCLSHPEVWTLQDYWIWVFNAI